MSALYHNMFDRYDSELHIYKQHLAALLKVDRQCVYDHVNTENWNGCQDYKKLIMSIYQISKVLLQQKAFETTLMCYDRIQTLATTMQDHEMVAITLFAKSHLYKMKGDKTQECQFLSASLTTFLAFASTSDHLSTLFPSKT
ncbi:MAG: hypothetical protein P0S94_04665, partial [Simkaniaceae bacterium]|nr:hypothetical protein [Simkaniaceae bacterium]